MSWMRQLYLTYDEIAKHSDTGNALTPLAHQYAKAQIEVFLKESGELVTIKIVDKEDARTLIPVTIASGGRAGLTIAPHPLCDTLSYVVKDYSKYCADEKTAKMSDKKYEAYIKNLKKWCESEYSHVKVRAIYQYLTSGQMLDDLIKSEILQLDEHGVYQNKKISGQSYEKALVRFKVIMQDLAISCAETDMSLVNTYIDFYLANQEGRRDICYFLGTEKVISDNHPKGVVPIAGNAKLVSANDSSGYTFRGRFREAEQACALSYEASQKIHSALAWLVKNQGETIGTKDTRTFVCWNPQGKKTIPLFSDLYGSEDEEEEVDVDYGRKLRNILRGYKDQFKENENILVMGLEAATAGRLSITYYNEFSARDFWDRIELWYDTCEWKFRTKKRKGGECSPTFKQIVQCAFGSESSNFIDVNDKVLKEQSQRLMKCMLEGMTIPWDIVNALVNRASTPTAYSYGNREYLLSTACAVIKKYYFDKKGEEIAMKLDSENKDRSYLFGRLLAIYDCAERRTYDSANERDTNAIRLQSAYVNHPMQTWLVLEEVMNPYFKKLGAKQSNYYKTMISGIVEMIQSSDETELNKRLKETYLIGYYLQRAELYRKKDEKQEVEDDE